ncbi:MAG: hypothetical protein EXR79_00525 [Myxococcales bacterium]|nr:hypothetical protein [Myxococcales bacterium]
MRLVHHTLGLLARDTCAACCALIAIGFGCASSVDVGGVWRGAAPIGAPGALLLHGKDLPQEPLGVELIVGHYGPDLAGIVRFYRNVQFDRRRTAEAPDRECACAYLHQGHVDLNTGRLTFTLKGCLPGGTTTATVRTRAAFAALDTDTLSGTLKVDDPDSPLHGQQAELRLERVAGQSDTDVGDLACTRLSDESKGNVSSGR